MNVFHLISLLNSFVQIRQILRNFRFSDAFLSDSMFFVLRDRKSKSYFQDNFFRKLMMESLQQRLREVMTECSVKETFDICGGMI